MPTPHPEPQLIADIRFRSAYTLHQLMALFGRFEQVDAAPNGVAVLVRRTG